MSLGWRSIFEVGQILQVCRNHRICALELPKGMDYDQVEPENRRGSLRTLPVGVQLYQEVT